MNDAPTLGYESDVGHRTTLRVVAHTSVFRVVRQPNEYLRQTDSNFTIVYWGPPNKIEKNAKGTLYRLIQRVSMTYSNISFFTISPNRMRKFDNLFHSETGRDRRVFEKQLATFWCACWEPLLKLSYFSPLQTKIPLMVEYRLVHNGHSH